MTRLCFSFSFFFFIYTPVFTVSLASEKRRMSCALSTQIPSRAVFFDSLSYFYFHTSCVFLLLNRYLANVIEILYCRIFFRRRISIN